MFREPQNSLTYVRLNYLQFLSWNLRNYPQFLSDICLASCDSKVYKNGKARKDPNTKCSAKKVLYGSTQKNGCRSHFWLLQSSCHPSMKDLWLTNEAPNTLQREKQIIIARSSIPLYQTFYCCHIPSKHQLFDWVGKCLRLSKLK